MTEDNLMYDVKHDNVVQLFDEQYHKTPDHPAIQFKNAVLTYDELNNDANRLANYLISENVTNNELVGICLERSLELGISILGILKSGAAYMPIDFEYPVDRISEILKSANCGLIITQQKFSGLFKESNCKVIIWEDALEKINCQSAAQPEIKRSKDDLLYVLFTSGSTGKPKGVAMRHEPLVNLMEWQKSENILIQPANTLQYFAITFDVSFQEIITCWSTGGCLFMIENDLRYNPLALLKFIDANKIERMFLAFSSLCQLCRIAIENNFFPLSLKDIITGGEQLQINQEVIAFFEKVNHCKLHNHYGPTETNVVTTYTFEGQPHSWNTLPPIGKPIANNVIYIVDEYQQMVKKGEEGELLAGGAALARGYLNREDLTAERFIKDPFSENKLKRVFKTGDIVKELPDGNLQFIGRKDGQVKIRGFRVELAEIEIAIASYKDIRQVVVALRKEKSGQQRLVAYVIPVENTKINLSALKKYLSTKLPDYMLPAYYNFVKDFPLTPSGKVDRAKLPVPDFKRPELSTQYIAPVTALEKQVAASWSEFLFIDKAGVNDNFFDLGGNSFLAVQFTNNFSKQTGIDIPVVKLYEYSTLRELCKYLEDKADPLNVMEKAQERKVLAGTLLSNSNKTLEDGIAIIGMSGRFPGAKNVEELWQNLLNGVESTTFFKSDELDPFIDEDIKSDPSYIAARGIINDADKFDAGFFGMNPKIAEITDPQQRIFLEIAWEALENAGYADESNRGLTGVFAGAGYNSYFANNVLPRKDVINRIGSFQSILSNEKDYLATLVSFMLNLKGPALSIHTACSTSLVAVIEAVKSLRLGECDMALAGGVAITSPVKSGHLFTEGSLFSNDGHTRTFSADATGTTFSDGAGIVVLKRYQDAVKDNDLIYSVIRGIGLNNDGHDKASFAAPSMQGQASAIALAQTDANIDADSISYIEAHGTATPIGDPIEIEALITAFRSQTMERQFCAIGSVKSNFGHLTAAAGVAGLIKTALALKNKIIPASINFDKPNPAIDFANSPFYVNTVTREWKVNNYPRRAGISSFGLGGTNAHVILEEYIENLRTPNAKHEPQLLVLSAKNETALKESSHNLVEYFKLQKTNHQFNFADVAYTLQTGRKIFNHKKVVIANDADDAIKFLQSSNPYKTFSKSVAGNDQEVVFIFPDQDDFFVNMAANLYESDQVFHNSINECCELLQPYLKTDLRLILFSAASKEEIEAFSLKQDNKYFSPALFVINYAAAKMFIDRGVAPKVILGSGINSIVAACISQVMSLKDALHLVALYGQLSSTDNFPDNSSINKLLKTIELNKPRIPVLSVVNSERINNLKATNPQTWFEELTEENHFSESIKSLWNENAEYVLLVFGLPVAKAKSSLSASDEKTLVVNVFGNDTNDRTSMLIALGQLWLNGINIDWKKNYKSNEVRKVNLPTYPFERQRYWIDPPARKIAFNETQVKSSEKNMEVKNSYVLAGTITQQEPILNEQVNSVDQNMMFALLMNQMQMQQQLMTLMLMENPSVIANGNAKPVN